MSEVHCGKQPLVAVVGPTASGKSDLAVLLAAANNGEVVSCDSMQIYSELSVSTARPTEDEMRGIPHHLLGFVSVFSDYNVVKFVSDAAEKIDDIAERGRLAILCGGTGLYYSSLVDGIKFAQNSEDPAVKTRLAERYEAEGGAVLLTELNAIDPTAAARLHPNDKGRIIRVLESYECTGLTPTEQARRSRAEGSKYNLCAIGITFDDREKLYERINLRVDKMVKNGLLDEAKNFYDLSQKPRTSAQAIGVKEFFPYFEGTASIEECCEQLKKVTRNYAKRQLTWFRRDERISFISADDKTPEEIFEVAQQKVENFLKLC